MDAVSVSRYVNAGTLGQEGNLAAHPGAVIGTGIPGLRVRVEFLGDAALARLFC